MVAVRSSLRGQGFPDKWCGKDELGKIEMKKKYEQTDIDVKRMRELSKKERYQQTEVEKTDIDKL